MKNTRDFSYDRVVECEALNMLKWSSICEMHTRQNASSSRLQNYKIRVVLKATVLPASDITRDSSEGTSLVMEWCERFMCHVTG